MPIAAPIIVAGVSMVSSVAQGLEADSQSKAAHRNAVEMSKRQVAAARDSALTQYGQLGRRESEEAAAASSEIQSIMKDARGAAGAVKTAAATGGIGGGNSLQALLDDYESQASVAAATVLRNERARRMSIEDSKAAVGSELRSQEINATVAPRRRVNWLTQGLNAASSGLSAYSAAGGTFSSPADHMPEPAAPRAAVSTRPFYGDPSVLQIP